MIWLLLLPVWCLALVSLVALCRAGHLEDVARGFVEDRDPLLSGTGAWEAALVRR